MGGGTGDRARAAAARKAVGDWERRRSASFNAVTGGGPGGGRGLEPVEAVEAVLPRGDCAVTTGLAVAPANLSAFLRRNMLAIG